MNKLAFQIIREDIIPVAQKVDTFDFIDGEKRTLAIQLLDAYNSQPYQIPTGFSVTINLPTADPDAPIQKSTTINSVDKSIVTADLTVSNTQSLISGSMLVVLSEDASPATKASGSIVVLNNTFNPGDAVTVEGETLVIGTDWVAGISVGATAINIATAINAAVSSVTATPVGSTINIEAKAYGESGNDIYLYVTDSTTPNFSVSGDYLTGGSFGTNVAKSFRKSIFVKTKVA